MKAGTPSKIGIGLFVNLYALTILSIIIPHIIDLIRVVKIWEDSLFSTILERESDAKGLAQLDAQ